ncbi:MAG: hypothetical protein WAX89_06915 [Alphaproteobacteria bacterium]
MLRRMKPKKPFGGKPSSNRTDRPLRGAGDRARSPKPYSDKPYRLSPAERAERASRTPSSDKPRYDTKPFEDRPRRSFGDRPARAEGGERKP